MFDSSFFTKLSKLKLSMDQKSDMNMAGSRKSRAKGSSVEFSDFREYLPGDDLRRLDWNAYARMDKMFIKEYMEEREIVVSILIDTSASMQYGKKSKADLALQLAAAVSYIAINNMDRVMLYDMKHMGSPLSVAGSKKSFNKVLAWLRRIEFSDSVDIYKAVKSIGTKGSGITFILSDFLDENIYNERAKIQELCRYLDYKKQKASLIHILAHEEIKVDEAMKGTLNLIDMENDNRVRVTIDKDSVSKYSSELNKFTGAIKGYATRNNGTYVLCNTAEEFDKIVFKDMRAVYDI